MSSTTQIPGRIVTRKPSASKKDHLGDVSCWVCGSNNTALYRERGLKRELTPDDMRITDARYGTTLQLRRCESCGFVFADEEDVHALVSLYEQMEDTPYEQTQDSRAIQMQWLIKRMKRIHPGARTILDVGAGAGLLVAQAREAGFEATGVEPSRSLVAAAHQIHKVELLRGVFPHPALAGRRFDVIFLADVLEHVSNPLELVLACREALEPDGVLIIVTPDAGSLTAKLLGRRWWHLRLAHVGYFDRGCLTQLARHAKMEPIHYVRPTWFLPMGYLARRVARYLPVGWFNRWAERFGPTRWLYERTIPVNPRDSMLMALKKTIC